VLSSRKVVAIVATNPALLSILNMVLAERADLRVRAFESVIGLCAYMRITPVDLVVVDVDADDGDMAAVAALRTDPLVVQRVFQILVLSRQISGDFKRHMSRCGTDEVIVKPMSPKLFEERVTALLGKGPQPHIRGGAYVGPERRTRLKTVPIPIISQRADNVVQLFPAKAR